MDNHTTYGGWGESKSGAERRAASSSAEVRAAIAGGHIKITKTSGRKDKDNDNGKKSIEDRVDAQGD